MCQKVEPRSQRKDSKRLIATQRSDKWTSVSLEDTCASSAHTIFIKRNYRSHKKKKSDHSDAHLELHKSHDILYLLEIKKVEDIK